jgi:steroid 5-alpha reductase family enzyme
VVDPRPFWSPSSTKSQTTTTLFDAAGTLLWAAGFFFEAVGDWQLARFKTNPANEGR